MHTYVLHDDKSRVKETGGAFRINRKDASNFNERGFGIRNTVNLFRGKRRLSNLVTINAWFVEMDGAPKNLMLERIKLGLIPTLLVESKNGFHVYWKSKDATVECWPHIVSRRLIPFYDADPNAKDITRLLRVPGYYHMKDPKNPFLVRKVHEHPVEYSEREMLHFYKDLVTPREQKQLHQRTFQEFQAEGDFWEKIWNLNCEYALEKLSGTQYVGGEIFTFQQNAVGTKQIWVNGKSTSCWIDRDGRIGSLAKGGPTIFQWLNWYQQNGSKTIAIIKEVFPECQTTQLSLI